MPVIYNKNLIEFKKPHYAIDVPEKIGNFLMAPLRQVWGHRFKMVDDIKYVEKPSLSKIKKVVLAVSCTVLFPVTLPMSLAGWVFTVLSKSHAKSYEDYKNGIAQAQIKSYHYKPKENKFENLYSQYLHAVSAEEKNEIKDNFVKALHATPAKQLAELFDDWFKDMHYGEAPCLFVLTLNKENDLPALVIQKVEKELREALTKGAVWFTIDTISPPDLVIYLRVCGDHFVFLDLLKSPRLMKGNEVKFLKALFGPKIADINPTLLGAALKYLSNLTSLDDAIWEILKFRTPAIEFSALSPKLITPFLKVLEEYEIDIPSAVAATLTPSAVQACLKAGPVEEEDSDSDLFYVERLLDVIMLNSDENKCESLLEAAFDSLSVQQFQKYIYDKGSFLSPRARHLIMQGSRNLATPQAQERLKLTLETVAKIYRGADREEAVNILERLFETAKPAQSLFLLRTIINNVDLHGLGFSAMEVLYTKGDYPMVVRDCSDRELQSIAAICFKVKQLGKWFAFNNELKLQGKII